MERGFALSEMGALIMEYNQQGENELSLFMRTTSIASKKALGISDVLDRGVNVLPQPVGRFSLETAFLFRTDKAIKDMQFILNRASALVPGRTSCFTVDPHACLMAVLRSAQDLDELHVAWSALAERMDLAQRNFKKYQSEFGAEKPEDILLSPVSTNPEIYRRKVSLPYPTYAISWITSRITASNGRGDITTISNSCQESCVLRNTWNELFLRENLRRDHLRSIILQKEFDRK
jgi:hypothetical protein